MKTVSPQLVRYAQVAVVGTFINFCSRFIFACFFSFGISVIAANYVGMLLVFFLSYKRVFKARSPTLVMALRFALVAHVGLVVVWFTAMICHGLLSWVAPWILAEEEVACFVRSRLPSIPIVETLTAFLPQAAEGLCHGTGIVIGFMVNFWGHKYFSFHSPKYLA